MKTIKEIFSSSQVVSLVLFAVIVVLIFIFNQNAILKKENIIENDNSSETEVNLGNGADLIKKDIPIIEEKNSADQGLPTSTESSSELMYLALYIQDRDYVENTSCSVTKKVFYKVPKTSAVADASLKILFSDELSQYATYKSIKIIDGVAKITLGEPVNQDGRSISSLSSCESSHLLAVLEDTLTQYQSINSIEIFNADGSLIQF